MQLSKLLLIIFIVLIGAASLEAASFYSQLKDSERSYWLRLLHYKKSFGGYRSRADGKKFFLHSEGKSNPQSEFDANIKAFLDPNRKAGRFKQHPQCVFPERYRFIKSLKLTTFKDVVCDEFLQWRKGIDAKSVTVVFSAAYPNNPASLFGHTFLRFNRKHGERGHSEKQSDLLDYAAAFNALVITKDWGPIYAYKGLFGGYPGYFDFTRYYQRVNDYSNAESRDLFEYELNIEEELVQRMVNHLWEIYSTTHFDYYFLDENCSYVVAAIIGIVKPEWKIDLDFRWYFLPSDLIKQIDRNPHAISNLKVRLSLKNKLKAKFQQLSPTQRDRVKNFEITSNSQELDALIAYLDFKKYQTKGVQSPAEKKLFREILVKRSQMKDSKSLLAVEVPAISGPEKSHDPYKLTVGSGVVSSDTILNLKFNPGHHDLLADDTGMAAFSEFEFFDLNLFYLFKEKKFDFERFGIISITSLHPYTFYDPQFSWKLATKISLIEDFACRFCHKFDGEAGIGHSLNLINEQYIGFYLLKIYGEYSPHFEDSYRLAPAVEWKVIGNPWSKYKFSLGQEIKSDILRSVRKNFFLISTINQSYSIKTNWEMRLNHLFTSKTGSWREKSSLHELELSYFF